MISWSGLKRWENCKQHQLRVIKHETERSNKGRIFLPGTVCDLTQRRWLESEDPQPGQMVDIVEEVFREVVESRESVIPWRGNPLEDQRRVIEQCRRNVMRLEPWLVENVLPYGYEAEKKFKAHMEIPYLCEGGTAPLMMVGGIDIVVQDDKGKFRLYDLKITEDPNYIKSTLAQLIFYDIAWGVINEDFEACVEWAFVTPALEERIIPIKVTLDDRRMMMSRVVKYAQGVWADNWEPKSNDVGCGYCEAKGSCEKFRKVPVRDENGKQRLSFAQSAAQRLAFRDRTSET